MFSFIFQLGVLFWWLGHCLHVDDFLISISKQILKHI